jgi:DNA polymerase
METKTFLKRLENQLEWFRQQKYKRLNLAPLATEESRKLTLGLQAMMGIVPENNSSIAKLSDDPLLKRNRDRPSSETHSSTSIPGFDSLENLEQQYCTCQRCPLGAGRTNFVFGVGHRHTVLLFIGEAPGAEEDRLGEPFVGRAGKLLTTMIQSIGIDRPDVYIANVVKCRPPGNRNPQPEEIAKCFPILQRQIELIDPRLIVTLGNVPTRVLAPNAPGITISRGKLYSYQQWSVLPTFHPAYLLRNSSAMALAWNDFKKIRYLCFEQNAHQTK